MRFDRQGWSRHKNGALSSEPLRVIAIYHNQAIHEGACHSSSYCTLDKLLRYWIYCCSLHERGEQCDLHAKHLYPSLACYGTSSILISDALTVLEAEQQYSFLQQISFLRVAFDEQHAVPSYLVQTENTSFSIQSAYLYGVYSFPYFLDYTILCASHDRAFFDAIFFLYIFHDIACHTPSCHSYDQNYIFLLFLIFVLCYLNNIFYFYLPALPYVLRDMLCFSLQFAFCSSNNVVSYILWYILCISHQSHRSFSCLWESFQGLEQGIFYMRSIAFVGRLEVSCRSWKNLLSFIAAPVIAVTRGQNHIQIYLFNYSINPPQKQLHSYFSVNFSDIFNVAFFVI